MRNRKPLDSQSKNLTKEEKEEKLNQEKILKNMKNDKLYKAPSWLRDSIAKKKWKELIEVLLEDSELISNADSDNIGAYCDSFSEYIEYSKKLRELKKENEEMQDYIEGISKNGTKYTQIHSLVILKRQARQDFQNCGKYIGLDLNSRLKLAELRLKSEEEEDEYLSKFGDW